MASTEPKGLRGGRLAAAVRRHVAVLAIAACVPTALALFGRWSWFCDLFTHYPVYYAAVLLPCGLLLIWFRGLRGVALLVLGTGLWNLALVAPLYIPRHEATTRAAGGTLRVLVANVNTANRRSHLVDALIARKAPDIVLLMEVNGPWLAALEDRLADYPHRLERPRDDNFGIALYSRLPFDDAEIVELGQAELPSVVARLTFDGKRLTVVGTHPLPPMNRTNFRLRNEQLQALAALVRPIERGCIVLGDLNTTSWSPHFRDFLAATGLIDSRRGFGVHPTWIALRGLIRIPIDHVLASPDIAVLDRRVGPKIGSDHRPVIVDLSL